MGRSILFSFIVLFLMKLKGRRIKQMMNFISSFLLFIGDMLLLYSLTCSFYIFLLLIKKIINYGVKNRALNKKWKSDINLIKTSVLK